MKTTGKTHANRTMLTGAIAVAFGIAGLVMSSNAIAQSVTCCAGAPGFVPTTPGPSATIPTPPATIPTPPPVVVVIPPPTPPPPPPPPPVVVVTTPTPPRMPERPNTWMNVPSDMSKLTQFDSVSSIDRLLREPTAINLTIPRAPVQNKLENRLPSSVGQAGANATSGALDAVQALENAKPLI